MLRANNVQPASSTAPVGPAIEKEFSLPDVVGFFRRQWIVVATACGIAVVLGLAYLIVTAPLYTAKAQLMIDSRKVNPFAQQAIVSELTLDSTFIDSQVEVLKSDAVGLAVVDKLKLFEDPEFGGGARSFIRSLMSGIGNLLSGGVDAGATSTDELRARALNHFKANLTIQRVGRTYVLAIGYRSLDASKAAFVANGVGEAYIEDQLQANFDATKRASDWLQSRIAELRDDATAADRAVQDYKAKHGLIEAGGRLVSDQQLGDVNTQLVQARAQVAEAKARLDQILAASASDVPDPTVTDALSSGVISKIRQDYLDASRREAEFSARYGSNHQAVVNLRKEMEQLRLSARAELNRIGEAYRSDHAIAVSRQESLEKSLQAMVANAQGAKQAGVDLRMLESSAQSYRTLYDSFLQRFADSTQQQSFPKTEARVITPATRGEKSHPKGLLVLGAAVMAGLFGGVGIAFAREQLDQVFKTGRQVEGALGVECLGILPVINPDETKAKVAALVGKFKGQLHQRNLALELGMERHVVHSPFSRFTETIRSIKVTADMHAPKDGAIVIGVVSTVPGEGKSTVAANLAQLLTNAGNKVLLIDGDLRMAALTKRMAPQARTGLLQVLDGSASFRQVLWQDPITKLDFVAGYLEQPIAHTAELIASSEMAKLLEVLRSHYRYIIVDLPPLGPVIDAKAAAELIDKFLMVIEWGQTAPAAVVETLASAEVIQARLLGAVLNKADLAALKRIEPHKGNSYYSYYSYGEAA